MTKTLPEWVGENSEQNCELSVHYYPNLKYDNPEDSSPRKSIAFACNNKTVNMNTKTAECREKVTYPMFCI